VRAFAFAAGLLAALALAGCAGDGNPQIGTGEPFRVQYPDPNRNQQLAAAQFVRGPLPGEARHDAGTHAHAPDAGPGVPPRITQIDTAGFYRQGQGGAKVTGRASETASAVGISLDGVGTGYWVVPIGEPDGTVQGEFDWTAVCDFADGIPAGNHSIRVVAIDGLGTAGETFPQPVCIASRVPDNFHSCRPKRAVPEAVISLEWDANVDLDLQVVAPDGRLIDPKHPYSEDPNDAGVLPRDVGKFDRDSNPACALDGIRMENLVWKDVKPHGTYQIYANLFDACKQPAVRFTVSVYTKGSNPDGGEGSLVNHFSQSGELMDFQANGDSARGLFISEFVFH
jgi:hypothetical protein